MDQHHQPALPLLSEAALGDAAPMEPDIRNEHLGTAGEAELIRRFVLIRESDGSDLLLLTGMAQQTIAAHLNAVPDLEVLVDDPIGPVNDPARRHLDFRLDPNTRVVLTQIRKTLVIYYMGSAASRDSYGDSKFGTFMADLIENHRPAEIRCGPFTRLGRSMKTFTTLLEALQTHRVKIITSESELRPWQPSDEFMWGLLAAFATQERSSIVSRTVYGKVAKALRGGSLSGDWGVPFGYHIVDGIVVPDLSMRESIREALLLLADPKLSSVALRDRLAALGFQRRRPNINDPDARSIASVVDAKSLRRGLIGRLSLYQTGIHRAEVSVPLAGLDSIGSVPVTYPEGSDKGKAVIECDWGVPEGGWAEDSVFDAIRAAEKIRRSGRTGSGRTRRPFSSLPTWVYDNFEYRIGTNDTKKYRLERRRLSSLSVEVDAAKKSTSTQQVVDRFELLGRIDTDDLAKVIADATTAALESTAGLPVALDDAMVLPAHVARSRIHTMERDRQRAASLRSMHQRARRRSAREEDDELAAMLLSDAASYLDEARAIEAELASLESSPTTADTPPRELTLNITSLRRVLDVLAETRGAVPASVADALTSVIQDVRIFPVRGTTNATVSFSLVIPTDTNRVARLGPITTTTAISAATTRGGPLVGLTTRRTAVIEAVAGGATLLQTAERLGSVGESRAETHLREAALEVGAHPAMARIFAIAAVPELQILLARLTRAKLFNTITGMDRPAIEKVLSDGDFADETISVEWAAYVIDRYALPPAHRDWSLINVAQQTALDLIAQHGGSLDLRTLHNSDPDLFSPRGLSRLILGHRQWPAVVTTVGQVRWADQLHRIHDATVTQQTCPHCGGGLDKAIAVPEIPSRLLCSACRQPDENDAPRFPDSYFNLPIQTRRRILGYRASHAPDKVERSAERGLPVVPRTFKRRTVTDVAPDVRQQICEAYRNGTSVTGPNSICDQFEIGTHLMYAIVDDGGVPRRQAKIDRTTQ